MPVVIQGAASATQYVGNEKFDYAGRYPQGVDLSPMSPQHMKLAELIRTRARESFDCISRRYNSWNEIDEMLTVYIKPDKNEVEVTDKDKRKPVSIVVPYMYAQLETLLTYLTMAFLEDDTFVYEGASSEYQGAAKMAQFVVNRQVEWFKGGLKMHTCFRDGLAYGIGAATTFWTQKEAFVRRQSSGRLYDSTGRVMGADNRVLREKSILYEGNRIDNIDPYDLLPDPNVSITDVQEGEMFGWCDKRQYLKLLEDEQLDETMFNVRYLRGMKDQVVNTFFNQKKSKRDKHGVEDLIQKGSIPLINLFMTILPREYGLPGGEYPEKWMFTLAADMVIIRAIRLDLDHNSYPVAVNAPDFDGYSVTPLGRLEMLFGLQNGLNWLFNSHMANVRKAINDSLIVDPSLVNMNDFNQEGPGRLIRLRRAAWGRGVENAVKQLNIQDVTQKNINDALFIMDIMNRVSSATDSTMGIMRSGGERRSAAEYRGTSMSAMSRIEHVAKMISMQFLYDMALFMVSQTQQFMQKPVYMKITGMMEKELQNDYGEGVLVDPWRIAVPMNIKIKDGSLPTKGAENIETWSQLFQTISTNPQVAQRFDVVRVFKHIARLAGAKNIDSFELKANVQPNETVQSEVQKGNLIAI